MKKNAIWVWFFLFALFFISFLALKPYYAFAVKTLKISPFKTIFSSGLLKSFDGQVSIVLLGIAGESHDGPNLSDSIMVVNYNMKTNKVTTISVPRDIWSKTLRDRINSAYAYGEAKKPGKGGFILAKSEISEVVGFPIHYAAAIEFERFKELINFLGGVEIDIKRSFTDKKFPITGRENDDCNGDKEYKCRYETVSFTKGPALMDGETALKFMRSRNSESEEGSDFAREQRQQQVIQAAIAKTVSYAKRPSVDRYSKLYSLLNDLVKRDIDNQEIAIVFKNAVFKGKPEMKKIALTSDFFVNPPISDTYDYRWVLIPKNDNFDSIYSYIKCEIEDGKKCSK